MAIQPSRGQAFLQQTSFAVPMNGEREIKVTDNGNPAVGCEAVPTDGEGEIKVPDSGKPALGVETSLHQTSFTVLTAGEGKIKVPDSGKSAGRNHTILRRRMEKERATVSEFII